MADFDVAVVGGGITGLSAARALCARGLRVRLFERDAACGGVVHTDHVDGFVVDTGPDTLLGHKPAALNLVRDVGLESELVAPLPNRTTYVLRHSQLRTLPETSALGLPINLKTLARARAFSWRGKLRMAAEPLVPAAQVEDDESIASFVGRRFGREAVRYVAEPVLAGLHRGDPEKLSMRALFPMLASAEQKYGSVARAWRQVPARSGSGSMSLRQGLGDLIERLQDQLPPRVAAPGAEVVAVERAERLTLRLRDGSAVSADAVLLATPAYTTATVTSSLDPELARLCASIRYLPSVNVALGYRRRDVRDSLRGWGFVVPRGERRHVRAVSWMSSKWPGRAPEGHVLIRVAVNAGDEQVLHRDDDTLIGRAEDGLKEILAISGTPVMARVYRRSRAMPQLEVGHLQRMAAIERRLASQPGLFVSASGFRGIGLADCVADAQRAAEQIAACLQRRAALTRS